jgi:hypothetical protein
MATYIKLCNGDCAESLPCDNCGGCPTLQQAAGGATTIVVNDRSYSAVAPFTSYEESCGEYCTFSGSSSKCGVGFGTSVADGPYISADSYFVSIGKNQDGDCGMTLSSSSYFIDGANGGDMEGSIFVSLTPFFGTYSIPMTGYITVNGETSPWSGTATITIS